MYILATLSYKGIAMDVSSGQPRSILPSKVGNVKLGNLIGRGNIGSVYRGYHETLAIDVAVKLLDHEANLSQKDVDRFIDEARIAVRINHPNIIRVYDCGLENNICYLIMEFVDGGNCEQLVQRNGRLTESAALRIIHAVVLSLKEAARHGTLHHDVKPANILLGKNGAVKLGDMGAAIMLGRQGMILGNSSDTYMTLEFAAPERILNGTETDIRSDIFSVGATLYYLLAGKPVRKGLSSGNSPEDIIQQPLEPVRALVPEISDACESFITRLLMTNPDKRYQSYAEVLNALAKITGTEESSSRGVIARSPNQLAGILKATSIFWYQNIKHLSKAGGIVAGISFLITIFSWGLLGYTLHLGSKIIIPSNIILQSSISGPLILGLFLFVMNIINTPGQRPKPSDLLKGFNNWFASAITVLCCESISLLAGIIFYGPFYFLYMMTDIAAKGSGCYAFYLLATGQVTPKNMAARTYKTIKRDYIGFLIAGSLFWMVEYLTAACLHPLVYIAMLTFALPFFSSLMFFLNRRNAPPLTAQNHAN